MKRVVYLAVAALVAMLILVPAAIAQQTVMVEQTIQQEKDLPRSGGVGPASLTLPAGALLLGAGVLGYAVLRRR